MNLLVAPAHSFFDPSYGSEPAWANNIVSNLAKNFEIHINVICGRGMDQNLPKNVKLFQVGYHGGNLYNRAFFTCRYYNLARKLLNKADIVHHMFPFGFRFGFNPLAVLGCLRKKPFVVGPVQYPQQYSDMDDFTWSAGKKAGWAGLLYQTENVATSLASKQLERLHKSTLEEAEALVFDSEKAVKLYTKQYPDILDSKLLHVIPPGVEQKFFVEPAQIDKKILEILTVGYLLKRKGIQHLIRAMIPVLEEFGNVKLKIVGDGPYKESLIRLTKELSLNDFVEFSGRVPRNELPMVYANSDLYVQPSLSETFPSALREAMAAGRPVVTTDVGVIGEYLEDGVNGYLVPPKSPEALSRKIITLLLDDGWRAKIGEETRKYAKENFDWNKLATDWYNIYDGIT